MTLTSQKPTRPRPADPDGVPRPAPIGRRTAIVCLVVGSVLNLGEALVGGIVGAGETTADWMALGEEQPALWLAAGIMGTVAVPFMVIGFLAMAQLIRPRMPRLAAVSSVFGYSFGFGFFGIHVAMLIQYVAISQPDRPAMIDLMDAAQSHAAVGVLVVLPFLLGALGAVLLLSIGMLRTRVVPRGIPALLLLFLVLDFGPFPTGPVDPHWLFVAASLWLAWHVRGLSARQWWLGVENAGASSGPPVAS